VVIVIKVVYEDNHLLVVEKPVNIPVQEDSSHDQDLLTLLKAYLKTKYNKPGNVYLGLVHRLDRPVGGLMVFAKTSKAASRLSDQLRTSQITKEYLAVVVGSPGQGIMEDYLIKDEQNNTSYISNSKQGKLARLKYETIAQNDQYSLVKIQLLTGRSHQIRVQFSSRNHPLWGDQKYNQHAKPGQQIALYANELAFNHPITQAKMQFELQPTQQPFSSFKKG
jgi:23S rRNA pseudouridine1911/1915/1917 synthase